MKYYIKYLQLTLKNTFKNPKNIFKTIPGLGFLLAGIVFFVMALNIGGNGESGRGAINRNLGILYLFGTSGFLLIVSLFSYIFNMGLGFRAADANILMKAPISNFEAYLFVFLKQSITLIGLGVFLLGTQGSGIVGLTGNSSVLFIGLVIYLLLISFTYLLGYLILYFKLKNKLLSTIVYCVILALIFVPIIYFAIKNGINVIENPNVHMIPIIGWALGIFHNYLAGNLTLTLLYIGLIFAVLVIMYIVCSKLKFDYYEFELSKVSKTEAAFQRAKSGKSDSKLFVKSNKNFKRIGAESIIDFENIKAGKYWFVTFLTALKLLAAIGVPIAMTFIVKEEGIFSNDVFLLSLILSICVFKMYLSGLSIGEGDIYKNFYLKLFPINTFKKVYYSNTVKIKLAILESVVLLISILAVYIFIIRESIPFLPILLLVISFTILSIALSIKLENIYGYLKASIGQVLTIIINLVETILFALILIGGGSFVLFNSSIEMVLVYAIIILSIYLAAVLYISKVLYDKVDFSEFNS